LAKVFAVAGPELKQISRLSVTILARERKFCIKAALCAKSIGVKYLIAGGIGYTCLVDETAAQTHDSALVSPHAIVEGKYISH